MTWENEIPYKCPFCGADEKGGQLELINDDNSFYYIWCKFCGATGPESNGIKYACMKWNRRVK